MCKGSNFKFLVFIIFIICLRVVTQAPPSVDPAVALSSANSPGGFSIRTVASGSVYASRSRFTLTVGDNVSFDEELKEILKQKHVDEEMRKLREIRAINTETDDVSVHELATGTSENFFRF